MSQHKFIKNAIKEATKYIPHQPPLQFFVHHNTLQAFEDLPFKKALIAAASIYKSQSFMTEEYYQKSIENGRIKTQDIEQVILNECSYAKEKIIAEIDHFQFRNTILHNIFPMPSFTSLNWHIKNQLQNKEDHKLFNILKTPSTHKTTCENNHFSIRNKILHKFDIDIDELVNPFLIKLAAAYLDQGLAAKSMPDRDKGFLQIFCKLYQNKNLFSANWKKELEKICKKYANQKAIPLIANLLTEMQIEHDAYPQFILHSLLSLKGWAGMFYQYEKHPQKMPVQALPATLEDFLAVKLILDFAALKFVLKQQKSSLAKINANHNTKKYQLEKQQKILQYDAFICAKKLNLKAENFAKPQAIEKWYQAVFSFDQFTRLYYLHLAYERRYRQNTLDALIFAQKFQTKKQKIKPKFQAVFCMDEREESLRRHLEELSQNEFETFGFAGFFGVAMQYKGLDDVKPRALCPITITPEILIEEIACDSKLHHKYHHKKNKRGQLLNFIQNSRQAIFNGFIWSFTAGLLKTIPLIGHSIFPRHTSHLSHKIQNFKIKRPHTRLHITSDGTARKYGFKIGFSTAEMSNIVYGLLNSMGIKNNLTSLFFVIGHGSSSLNNPHEAAHDCGATGGGRGGPNARAFAAMANNLAVKKSLLAKGINIENTYFIGGYHNTCDDSLTYYDLDLLPKNLTQEFKLAQNLLEKSCQRDAHERCRRFANSPKNTSYLAAKLYAEQHANDLAQPRPEYGHATNAICIIGERSKTTNLFLDRRAFLISYDPHNDAKGEILGNILQAAAPVGAGINLEYFFSFIDQKNYGCGTKLPHNITGLIGVMNGYSSDLRTGLPWQMVEIHEPVRLLVIVQTTPEILLKIASTKKEVGKLVSNEWIQLAAWDPENNHIQIYEKGKFVPHQIENLKFPLSNSSKEYYQNHSEHLNYAYIKN
jgi:uncharacterized protein YbcC (UPF0753/DUF2309 family)